MRMVVEQKASWKIWQDFTFTKGSRPLNWWQIDYWHFTYNFLFRIKASGLHYFDLIFSIWVCWTLFLVSFQSLLFIAASTCYIQFFCVLTCSQPVWGSQSLSVFLTHQSLVYTPFKPFLFICAALCPLLYFCLVLFPYSEHSLPFIDFVRLVPSCYSVTHYDIVGILRMLVELMVQDHAPPWATW